VLAHVAAQLPGWGDRELARRGRALAEAFVHEWLPPARYDARAREAAALAGSPAFAEAFLAGLGKDGMRAVLDLLGDGDFGADSPLPGLVAAVLGAAGPTGFSRQVDAVVHAPYVDAVDPGIEPDKLALGMGVVLAAAAMRGPGGLPAATVVAWGRQIILREHVQGASAVDRANPTMATHAEVDAVPLVVELLSRGDDSGAAAGLLADQEVWTVLLSRTWDDCGAGLHRVVDLAGNEDSPAGGTALRAGLEALGTGLEDGNPDGWTVAPAAARAIERPLAEGLAAHWAVPAGLLAAGADGEASDRDRARLRGLGYLTIDRTAATAVADAVTRWVAHQPPGVAATVTTTNLALVAVPAAYFAVQEYGQRLAHTLRAVELQEAAEARKWKWDATVGVASHFFGGRLNPVVGALESTAARLCDADGSWGVGPDRGLVFRREDAVAAGRAQTFWSAPADIAAMAAQARAAFDGTARVLGRLEAPTPPDTSWSATLVDAATEAGLGRSEDAWKAWRKWRD
jgi:hypothetical protein